MLSLLRSRALFGRSSGFLFVLVIFLAFGLVNLPIRLFAGDSLESVRYTDLNGASFLKGDVWIDFDDVSGLTHLVYNWCPGLSPLGWCVDLEHPAFDIEGRMAVSMSKRLTLSDINIQLLDLATLGLASGLVDARVSGRIESAEISISNCLIKEIESLEGQLSAENLHVFGFPAGVHQIRFTSTDSVIDGQLVGDTFSGNVQLSNDKYSAEGQMLAPEGMAGMAQSFMEPLGDNRFGWEISGDLPC